MEERVSDRTAAQPSGDRGRPAQQDDRAAPQAAERIPVGERRLDPRSIRPATLEAGRNASLWWVSAGIVAAMVVSLVVGPAAGVWALAGVVVAGAVARAVRPHPGPAAVAVRSKALDLTILLTLAAALTLLGILLPTGAA